MKLAMKLAVVIVKKHEEAAQLMRGHPKRDALTLTAPLEIKPGETQGQAIARKRAIVEFGLDIESADLELTTAGSGRQLGVSSGSSGSFQSRRSFKNAFIPSATLAASGVVKKDSDEVVELRAKVAALTQECDQTEEETRHMSLAIRKATSLKGS